jgi:hypothetical protein
MFEQGKGQAIGFYGIIRACHQLVFRSENRDNFAQILS